MRPYLFLGTVIGANQTGSILIISCEPGKRWWHCEEFYVEGVNHSNPHTGIDTGCRVRFTVTAIYGHAHGIALGISPPLTIDGKYRSVFALAVNGARVYDGSLAGRGAHQAVGARNTGDVR